MKSAILGIGSELTDGQILNKNASWISARLKEQGLQTSVHIVVPDEKSLILDALNFCREKADIIFVTGGLGPTTDDFTRDVIAEWSSTTLEFDDSSWTHLSERLQSRSMAVREIQRQQCYFPKGSKILTNPQGTANAFQMFAKDRHLFVLPGPPREIEAIWDTSIAAWVIERTLGIDPFITRKWDTIGLGESDIATLTEEALKNVTIEKGYRVHLPYVEVKLSYFKSQQVQFAASVQKVDSALKDYTLTRDGEDIAKSLATKLESHPFTEIIDPVTGAFLVTRLLPHIRKTLSNNQFNFSNIDKDFSGKGLRLQLKMQDEFSCEVSLQEGPRRLQQVITAPFKTSNMHERRLQYFCEYAFAFWFKNLS